MKLRLLKESKFLFNLVFLVGFFPLFVFGQVSPPIVNYSTYCQGESMPISATSSTPNASIEWYMSSNITTSQPFTVSQNGEIFPLDSLILFGLGTNKIYAVASLNGSKSSSVEVPITIDKKAVVIAIESEGCMLNRGDNVVFSPILENPNGNYTYEWRKIKTKLMAAIPNPTVLSTEKNFSKTSLTQEDAGIYELTVWNENRTCATKIEAPHLVIRGVCMPNYPIAYSGYLSMGISSYILLSENLSSSYFSTFNGYLSFKFNERYREGTLNAHIYNWERCEIGKLTLNKSVGQNWYTLDLNPVCTPGEYYVMEVFDENGSRSVLNFIFEDADLKVTVRNTASTHCPFFLTTVSLLIEGGISKQKIIWYVTSTNSIQEIPTSSSNWEMVAWETRDDFSIITSITYITTEHKVYWFKAKVIDGRGCSAENAPYPIKPEESQENLFRFSNEDSKIERAEYVNSRNSPLLKGIQAKAGFLKNNRDVSDVIISILKADGINQSPKTVLKSIQMSSEEFKNQVSQANDYTLLFDQLLETPDAFYISIQSNTNLFFWRGACNIPNEANTAWEKTPDGKWQALSTPVLEGGQGNSTSYSMYPIFDGKPTTDFIADLTLAFPNEEIEFRDISIQNPENYEWNLEGATTTSSTNPTFTTKYNQAGDYDVSLITKNISGIDTLIRPNYIKVIEDYSKLTNTEGERKILENSTGFIAGHNSKKDKAKAEYFSDFEDKFLQGVEIYLANLYIKGYENKLLRIDVMSANSDNQLPDLVVDSVFIPFHKVKQSIDKHGFVRVCFDEPIKLPENFYVSVHLDYYTNHKLAILTTPATSEKGNTAWEQLADNTWQPYSRRVSEGGRGISVAHAIYPILTANKVLSSEEENSYAENIKLFPNPASDFIQIETKSIKLENYSIVDVIGKTIKKGTLSESNTIQINNLTKGLYFIRFKTDKGMITKRFVVK